MVRQPACFDAFMEGCFAGLGEGVNESLCPWEHRPCLSETFRDG